MTNRVKFKDFARECDVWAKWHEACPQYVAPLFAAEFERRKAGAPSGRALYAVPACTLGLSLKLVRTGVGRKQEGRSFSPEACAFVKRLFASLLVSLDAAHSHNIVWSDLKPDNVMLAASRAPLIIDFGSAAHVPEGGLRHAPEQSPVFGTPECYKRGRGERGCPIDIWGLGSLATTAVLGCLDFFDCVDSKTDVLVPKKAARLWPTAASGAPAELGALHDLVFAHLLVADPARRATAAEAMGHPYFEGVCWDDVRSGAVWE